VTTLILFLLVVFADPLQVRGCMVELCLRSKVFCLEPAVSIARRPRAPCSVPRLSPCFVSRGCEADPRRLRDAQTPGKNSIQANESDDIVYEPLWVVVSSREAVAAAREDVFQNL
jgi:hypothetical protein